MNLMCDRVQSLLPHALEGNLDESRRADLLAHGRACPECASTFEFYKTLLAEREDAPSVLPPPVYYEGVLAEIHLRMALPALASPLRLRRPLGRRRTASIAASFFFGLWCCVAAASWRGEDAAPSGVPSAKTIDVASVPAASRPARLVAIDGVGLYDENSPVLKMTAAQRRELGLVRPERSRTRELARAERPRTTGAV